MAKKILIVFFVACGPLLGFGQVGFRELLEISTANYPELRAKSLESEAAMKEVEFQKSDLIPSLNASYQTLYSTNNNITGMFLPGNIMPISGPPNLENSFDFTFGSAAALLLNWTPFTFGKRDSRIQTAKSKYEINLIEAELAVLEHQVRFTEAYLNFWSASSQAKAAEANMERYRVGWEISRNLVTNGLRPGVDSAQMRSLWMRSKIEYLQAVRQQEALEARVRELLGEDETAIVLDQGLDVYALQDLTEPAGVHPLLRRRAAQTNLFLSQKTELNRSMLPDLLFWGTTYARGSAIQFDGTVGNPQDGLSFSKFNYGLGLQISIPILQFARTGKLTGRQDILISSSEAYEIQLERAFEKERTVAKVTLQKALESAQLAPDYIHTATFTYEALKARYDAGLIDLNEFVQGQAELARAEADKIKVQAEMWKALLYYAAVFGDIDVFIQSLP